MTGFLLKKFFYDLWDNLFFVMVLNLGFILFISLVFLLPMIHPIVGMILFGLLLFWLFVYICAATAALGEVSDYRSLTLASFFTKIKSALVPAVVLLLSSAFIVFMLWFTIPAYFRMGGMAGTVAAFFSSWLCLFLVGAIQFYPSVYYRLGMRPLKCLKKCVIIFLDNTAFCLGSLIVNVILTVLIIPAPCMPLLYLDQALRLRLLKYDWLDAKAAEQNNSQYEQGWRKTKIPWAELLEEERDKTGDRTWRSFIFPWKE